MMLLLFIFPFFLQRDAVRKNQEPSTLLDQIRRKNISAATSSSSPYRPISIIDKTFREDLARGVRRSKVNTIFFELIVERWIDHQVLSHAYL